MPIILILNPAFVAIAISMRSDSAREHAKARESGTISVNERATLLLIHLTSMEFFHKNKLQRGFLYLIIVSLKCSVYDMCLLASYSSKGWKESR